MSEAKPAFLRRPVTAGGGLDRRRTPRVVVRQRVVAYVELEGSEGVLTGVIRDLSRSGVGLVLPVAVEVGRRLAFRAAVGERAIRAVCHVANCRPDGRGGYVVGAEIVSADRWFRREDGVDEARVADVRRRLAEVVGSWMEETRLATSAEMGPVDEGRR